MESITSAGQVFDVGSLYEAFSQLKDCRKARGKRHALETVLTLIVLAKLCGEDQPSGIGAWANHRLKWLCEWLKLERKRLPYRSSYERIAEQILRTFSQSPSAFRE